MKARPRSVENRVADALNEHFDYLGMSHVERIPVLGRTGPDLTWNELKLIVDVKSRIEIPETVFFPLMIPYRFDGLVAVQMDSFLSLLDEECSTAPLDFASKIIRGYIEHMEKWTLANVPGGISATVLHKPKMPIGSSVVIIQSSRRRLLYDYSREYRNRYNNVPAE